MPAEGKMGHVTCLQRQGPQHFPSAEYRGRAILWDAHKEGRAATLILPLAGLPYRITQQYAASLMLIPGSNDSSPASAGDSCLMRLLGREFRAASYNREYADVVSFMQVRRTDWAWACVTLIKERAFLVFNLIKARAFQH